FLNLDFVIISYNRNFYDTFKAIPKKTIGRFIYDLGNKQWDIPKLRTLLEEILPKENKFNNYEVDHVFPDIGHKIMLLNARRITLNEIGSHLILLAIEDITERRRLETELQKKNNQYRQLADNAADGIFIHDKKGQFLFVNPRFCEMLGYTEDELLKMNILDNYIDEKEREMGRQRLESLASGEYLQFERRMRRKDGSIFWIEARAKALENGNIQAVVRDISNRMWVNDALRESEEKYRTILESIEEGYFEVDLAGNLTFFNGSVCRIWGYTQEELMGLNHRQYTDAENAKKLFQAFNEVYRTGKPATGFSWQGKRKDGTNRYIEVSIALRKDSSDKAIGFKGIVNDITERKQAEEALKKSEHKYRLLADNINDVIFVLDMNMNYTYVSPSVKILRGYEPEEVIKQSLVGTLTPSSMDLATRTISEVMELEKSGQKDIHMSRTLQLEMRRKDGTTVWTEMNVSFIRDENQQPIAILGLIRDITERRKEEERILLSEKRFKTLYQESPISTFTWQNKGDNFFLVDFNSAANVITEGKVRNYMGKNAVEMYRQRPEIIDEMLRCYKEQCIISRELISQDFTPGKYLSLYYSYIPPDLVIAHALDITESKKAEEALKQSFVRIRKALGAIVNAMAFLVETRDPYTAGHQKRVGDLARSIAVEIGLSSDRIDGIRMAATIHDIGKISIPAEILSTPRKLTDIEFSLIKTHSQAGYDILKDIEFPWPIARMVLEHHERMNGSGYPNRLKGDQTLLESRIISVADVVEAMASHRPYRAGLGIDTALDEITKNRNILYDPEVVDACLKLFREKKYEKIN
ncbi:MAG: PAS domain S-box protein, partial [Smithella sp.]